VIIPSLSDQARLCLEQAVCENVFEINRFYPTRQSTVATVTFTEGRLAGKSAIRYVRDLKGDQPQLDETGYYYRADYPKLNDNDWHVFTGSRYDAKTGEWHMEKLPVHHIIK
jgi:hypothetical protein